MSGWTLVRDEQGWGLNPVLGEESVGLTVRIDRWGWGARVVDVGLVGEVVGVGRTRLRIRLLTPGDGLDVGETMTVAPGEVVVVLPD